MPYINRLRLVNVNFNDAKGIYDDFMMNLQGKSTTYDLINTGGKSLLLLMLLQTIIPNTCLKKEKPVKNIFIGGNTKRTSHCLVEWILDEGYEYKYMVTGFCARKKQETESEEQTENKLEIDYYNYCYFYNEENKNDIKRLALVTKDGDEKIFTSYDKLRQLLNNLKKEGIPVEIFDSKKEYMKHIEYYGIIAAEWKLIGEINVSENYIEKYFKENKTSRKLIENFLIKIIDDVNIQNGQENENQLADTLIELKDNLMEFRKQSDRKNEWEQTKGLYESLKQENEKLTEGFLGEEKLNKKAYEAYKVQSLKLSKLTAKFQDEKNEIETLNTNNLELDKENTKLKVDNLYNQMEEIENKNQNLEEKNSKLNDELEDVSKKINLAKAQNEYIDYINYKDNADKINIQIEQASMNETDTQKEYKIYGYNYKICLEEKIEELKTKLISQQELKTEKEEAEKIAKKQENEARDYCSKQKSKLEMLEEQIEEIQEEIKDTENDLSQQGKVKLLLDLENSIKEERKEKEELKQNKDAKTEKINQIEETQKQKEIDKTKINIQKGMIEEAVKQAQEEIKKYEAKEKSIESLNKAFGVPDIQDLENKLIEEINNKEKERNTKQIEKQIKQRKLELIEKYNMVVPNEDIFHLKEKLENKCSYIITGIEKLKDLCEEKRREILNKNPLFIYSVFVDKEAFEKIKKQQIEIELENLVPIVCSEVLRGDTNYQTEDIIFPVNKSMHQTVQKEKLEEYKEELKNKIQRLENQIEYIKQSENKTKSFLDEVTLFKHEYLPEKVESIYKKKEDEEQNLKEAEKQLKEIHQKIENGKEEKQEIEAKIKKIEERENEILEEITILENLNTLQKKHKDLNGKKEQTEKEYKIQKEILDEKKEIYDDIVENLKQIDYKIRDIENEKEQYVNSYNNVLIFKEAERLTESFQEIKVHFEAIEAKVNNSNAELEHLQEMHKLYKSNMEKSESIIEENNYTVSYFANSNEVFGKVLQSVQDELNKSKKEIENSKSKVEQEIRDGELKYHEKKVESDFLIKNQGMEYLPENRVKDAQIIEKIIQENSMRIQENKRRINELKHRIENVDKQVRSLETEVKQLEDFVQEKAIKEYEVLVDEILENEVYSYRKLKEESSKIERTVEKLKNQFSESIRYMEDCIQTFYIKQDILETMHELKIPNKLEDCSIVKNGINIIIEQLEEKIKHIDEALKYLESYQENFITKCFEKAEIIVKDLEKLPSLSKIKIGGKDIPIIKMDLFEYEKAEKIEKMRQYIYSIVKEMEENPNEMTKDRVNEKLSSKALVSQIINMDKASVKLYKIEDIQEHSTYKKWEDDLGSDGQVNAIYFMFAVCVISYISMLTRSGASNKMKKVIIVDNPFGATSAVFLWEVMFAILKENNVQLIAPGHNINKEIISKFEVNYILKHEYYNGNKKSVVVDKELRTEDDMNFMNFATLEGEQQTIF